MPKVNDYLAWLNKSAYAKMENDSTRPYSLPTYRCCGCQACPSGVNSSINKLNEFKPGWMEARRAQSNMLLACSWSVPVPQKPPPNPKDKDDWTLILSALAVVLSGASLCFLYILHLRRKASRRKTEMRAKEMMLKETQADLTLMDRAWNIDFNDLKVGPRIDSTNPGQFGEVYFAKWRGLDVAVKKLHLKWQLTSEAAVGEFNEECRYVFACLSLSLDLFILMRSAGTYY
jgi:hypothetical protein